MLLGFETKYITTQEGPNTQYLRSLVQKIMKGMACQTRVLKLLGTWALWATYSLPEADRLESQSRPGTRGQVEEIASPGIHFPGVLLVRSCSKGLARRLQVSL